MKKMKINILSFMSVLLTVCIFFSITVSAAATEDTYTFIVPGDVDCNKFLEIKDVTLMQKHLASVENITEAGLLVADYNGDGNSNILDATEMQKCLVGIDYDCIIKPKQYLDLKESYTWPQGTTYKQLEFKNVIYDHNAFYNANPYADNRVVSDYKDVVPSLITSKEEFFAKMGFYSPQFNDEYFEENALIALIVYQGKYYNSDFINEITIIDDVLVAKVYSYRSCDLRNERVYTYDVSEIKKKDLENVNQYMYYQGGYYTDP